MIHIVLIYEIYKSFLGYIAISALISHITLGTLITFILTITARSVEVLHFASLGGRSNPKYSKCTCSKGVGLVQTPILSVTSMKSEGSVTDRGKILTYFPLDMFHIHIHMVWCGIKTTA